MRSRSLSFTIALLSSLAVARGALATHKPTAPCEHPEGAPPAETFWSPIVGPGTNWALDVAFDPGHPERVLVAGAPNGPFPGGVFLSEDAEIPGAAAGTSPPTSISSRWRSIQPIRRSSTR